MSITQILGKKTIYGWALNSVRPEMRCFVQDQGMQRFEHDADIGQKRPLRMAANYKNNY